MASIGAAIESKLVGVTAINNAVSGNVFPVYRDDVTPSLVYGLSIDFVEERYDGTGPIAYELTVSVIAERYKTAVELADLVIDALDRAEWTSNGYRIIDCRIKDRDEDYIDKASKNKRLAVVDLRFELLVDGATAT